MGRDATEMHRLSRFASATTKRYEMIAGAILIHLHSGFRICSCFLIQHGS